MNVRLNGPPPDHRTRVAGAAAQQSPGGRQDTTTTRASVNPITARDACRGFPLVQPRPPEPDILRRTNHDLAARLRILQPAAFGTNERALRGVSPYDGEPMRKRATKQQIITSLGLLAAVAAAGWWWWPHIHFRFQLARNNVHIRSVPVTDLKAPGQTAGWYDCRLGPVSLRLPLAFADKAERTVDKAWLKFATPEQELAIVLPSKLTSEQRAQNQKTIEVFKLSPTRLVAQSFRTGTDDFRWTMTRSELQRYQMLLRMKAVSLQQMHAMGVETRYDAGIEGLLIRSDRHSAVFQWQTASGTAAGMVLFSSKESDLDLDMVRDVCQSLACDETQLLERQYSRKELRDLLDDAVMKPIDAGGERDAADGEK